MKQIFIKARDGYRLDVHIFQAEHETAVVQLIHGMEEHQKRYEPFIAHLNAHGFSVVSSDLRGHGRHAADLGFFKEKGGYAEPSSPACSFRSHPATMKKPCFREPPISNAAHTPASSLPTP